VIHILHGLRVIEVEAGFTVSKERESIMAMKPFIRIIKRGQQAAQQAETGAQPRPTAESSARDIKTTVSTWVKEFQQRSRTDSKRAFNNLFKEPLTQQSGT
jgi:hypothetical protein